LINGLLRIVGFIIIAIALIAMVAIGNNSYQKAMTKRVMTSAVSNDSDFDVAHNKVIHIAYGAGRPGFRSIFFEPPRTSIHVGDQVRWINDDAVSHTVTSTSFNSGMIWPSKSPYGTSDFGMVFNKAGTYSYFCQIHPYMSGIVYVDVQETERVLKNPTNNIIDVKIEMPQNTAYLSKYGPYFIPSYAVVPSGSKVTWTNKDYIPHTATATDGSFDTEPIIPGKSKTINIDHNSGTVAYYCEIHPWMQATIQVESPAPKAKTI
jgi:plastocyanin